MNEIKEEHFVKKSFFEGIYISWGPAEGMLARPCMCGNHTDPDTQDLHLIQWKDGSLMFVHTDCVEGPDA